MYDVKAIISSDRQEKKEISMSLKCIDFFPDINFSVKNCEM